MKHFPIAAGTFRSLYIAALSVLPILSVINPSNAQAPVLINDLSAFKDPGKNWKMAGRAVADLTKDNVLKTTSGQGILVNSPDRKNPGSDLYTIQEFSDVDIELDYMMAKNANSGIFLQSRYEVQLRDNWGEQTGNSSSNGGIHARFSEARGKGNEEFEGHAPRQNVSRAPGLWQHLKISFAAPKFDAAGNKIQNARFLRVELNGVLVQENVELLGPTRGAVGANEAATAPLRIQGDHGTVAFRNFVIKNYNGQQPVLTYIHYDLYYGKYETVPDFSTLEPDEDGTLEKLSTSFLKKDQEFLIRYTGTVQIKQPGEYIFLRETNGKGAVKVNNKQVSNIFSYLTDTVHLEAGNFPFEIVYTKPSNWFPTSFGLTISSNNVREFLVSDEAALFREYPDPIAIEAPSNLVHRSFIDIPEGKRITHAANVGNPLQLHYTYDMDYGTIVQAWRGGFLDATPMWVARGDGSALALGSRLQFGLPQQTIVQLGSPKDSVNSDTANTGFVTKGYELNDNITTFLYNIHGAEVKDALQVTENGMALKRILTVSNNPGNLYVRMAAGKTIENISKGWYLVDNNSWYIRIDDATVPVIRQTADGHTELLAPVQNTVSYSILF